MPHPFSRVFPDKTISIAFGSNTPSERPAHSVLVAEIIATASEIETLMGDTLQAMLGADARPALAMYGTLRAAHIQNAALTAVAKVVLDEDTQDLMEVVLGHLSAAMKERNRLAHWHWGYCPEDDDALLMMEPDARRSVERAVLGLLSEDGYDAEAVIENFDPEVHLGFDFDRILVYRLDDLRRALDALNEARAAVGKLHDIIAPSPRLGRKRDELWRDLVSQKHIAEGLRRLRSRRQNTPPEPQ